MIRLHRVGVRLACRDCRASSVIPKLVIQVEGITEIPVAWEPDPRWLGWLPGCDPTALPNPHYNGWPDPPRSQCTSGFFLAEKGEEFVHLCILHLLRQGRSQQLLGVGLDPVSQRLMMQFQLPPTPTQVGSIPILLNGFAPDGGIAALWFLLRGVAMLANLAEIALAPRLCLPVPVLLDPITAAQACHALYSTHILSHSP